MAPVAESKEYRIAASLRRCCWYVIVAAPVLLAISILIDLYLLDTPPDRLPVRIAIALFCLILATIPLTWRWRVDEQGIHWRRLFHWHSWLWTDLMSRRIVRINSRTLADPRRPWGRREVSLDLLDEKDAEEVVGIIDGYSRRMPPREISESLTVTYGLRKKAIFSEVGIQIYDGRLDCSFACDELKEVYILRRAKENRYFSRMIIEFKDGQTRADLRSDASGDWRYHQDAILDWLDHHVPSEKKTASIVGKPPACAKDYELRIAEFQLLAWLLIVLGPVFSAVVIGALVWISIDRGNASGDTIEMVGLMIVVAALTLGVWWKVRSEIAKYKSQLTALRLVDPDPGEQHPD